MTERMKKTRFVPVTPAGTPCDWLASKTVDEAWQKLMEYASYMPYRTKEDFIKRGYTMDVIVSYSRRHHD